MRRTERKRTIGTEPGKGFVKKGKGDTNHPTYLRISGSKNFFNKLEVPGAEVNGGIEDRGEGKYFWKKKKKRKKKKKKKKITKKLKPKGVDVKPLWLRK